jgi:mono/diheme cytochrome c family protein
MTRTTALVLAGLGLVVSRSWGQDAPPPPPDSAPQTATLYSAEQARRGQATYGKHCVSCHSAATYTGAAFRMAWGNQSVYQLWEQIRTTMPMDGPGKLSPREYADIVAYLLKLNGLPAGPTDLPSDPDRLKPLMITIPRPGG